MLQVAHEAGLVHRLDRADAHRAGGELPEVRHQPRMRIRAQPLAFGLAPEVVELGFGQSALQEGPRVDTRCRVGLEVDQVATIAGPGAAEEVIEADFKQVCRRGIAGNMAAQLAICLVGTYHHGERVPAHDGGNAFLHGEIAWIWRLALYRYRVEVRRIVLRGGGNPKRRRGIEQPAQQVTRPLLPALRDDGLECLQPFPGFLRIVVALALGVREQLGMGRSEVGHGHGSEWLCFIPFYGGVHSRRCRVRGRAARISA
ncbi:hypothetical protein FQZ97_868320 [compost metagenome]